MTSAYTDRMWQSLSPATWWWLLAGVLVLAEMLSGLTFYMLMLALGAVAGALAAHLGLAMPAQMIIAALVGGAAVAGWHLARLRHGRPPSVSTRRDVNLDIGETLNVTHWHADGRTQVQYRGSQWQARREPGAVERLGAHVVVAVQGNHLVLAPVEPVA